MKKIKFSLIFVSIISFLLFTGCASQQEVEDLKLQNSAQRERIAKLESELQATKLKLDQAQRKLQSAQQKGDIEADALRQQVEALEKDLQEKKALIDRLKKQVMAGGVKLPVELNSLLKDFAESEDMVTYDESKGMVKFKSDLLFQKGSADVAPSAREAVQSLGRILNTDQGKQFDVIVAGHTDNIPIAKPSTKAKHPTNWHLSAHRAISVLKVLSNNNVDQERMSVRGFGEYRPIAPNKPGNKGNPKNRRVEIYIVPKGA